MKEEFYVRQERVEVAMAGTNGKKRVNI